jgi:hypothetical protein
MNSRALLLRENKWEVLMKVLGAKLPDHEFEKYLELCEKAGITKSDFARLSFKFFYLSIMSTNAKKIWLFKKTSEPRSKGQTQSPSNQDTFVRSDFLLREKESGP